MEFSESSYMTETKLKRIAALSAANPDMIFTHVIHHINIDSMRTCFLELDGRKAKGNDGIDKASYGENLEINLQNLMERMQRMAYIPGAVRQVLIPKEGKVGATRPLGISNFEDKIVQKMMQRILESIYEPLFSENSYGFRPRRSCHDAIEALYAHLYAHQIETVIDVDLSNFFGSISHHKLMEIIETKISDPRLVRYLWRMLKAGVLAEGDLIMSDEGVPQGSICSPVLSNIFAHVVIDEWIETTVKAHCAGEIKMVRYADDLVIACQYNTDAERIKIALGKRLEKYGLKMNEDKTKLVKFSRHKQRGGEKQQTFDFLGFTFFIGKTVKGHHVAKVKTNGKRLRSKLKRVNEWARSIKNKATTNQILKIAAAKVRGHIQYYGVSFNWVDVNSFVRKVRRILYKWINRRSQRKSFTWETFQKRLDWVSFPVAKICHKLF
jgi:group II intron reverse transcriptase/maturase